MDWDAYAQHYDVLCELNPAYHENIDRLIARLQQWDLPAHPRVLDLGAGTGNFILAMAKALPSAQFCHADFDSRMLALAERKYAQQGVENVRCIKKAAEELDFSESSFDLVVCVNALYAFPKKDLVLSRIRDWLSPSGKLFLIDFGRKQSTLEWTFYIFRESMKSKQIGKYAKALLESREILKQNRRATKGQESGRYWLHSTEEFGATLESVGFKVDELFECYRGYADFAVCSK
jgi:ubiquinone/menaquinone biosynthesis C-methylase UbiE